MKDSGDPPNTIADAADEEGAEDPHQGRIVDRRLEARRAGAAPRGYRACRDIGHSIEPFVASAGTRISAPP